MSKWQEYSLKRVRLVADAPEPESLQGLLSLAEQCGIVSLPEQRLAAGALFRGVIDTEQLKGLAVKEGRLDVKLVRGGYCRESDLLTLSALGYGLPVFALDPAARIDDNTLLSLPPELALQARAVAVERMPGRGLLVLLESPLGLPKLRSYRPPGEILFGVCDDPAMIGRVLEARVRPQLANYRTGQQQPTGAVVVEEGIEEEDREVGQAQAELARILNMAITRGASDVHFESTSYGGMVVRARIDGVLEELLAIANNALARAIISVCEQSVLGIDPTNNMPREARGSWTNPETGKKVDLRGQTFITVNYPTHRVKDLVLRILDQDRIALDIDSLALSPHNRRLYEQAFRRSSGCILICGPTGSGKTTTLYATLEELNRPDVAILTIEDPVEYRLNNISQMSINAERGLTFFEGLRAALRCDPDIIMVGEIRDAETANVAMRASISGHLVLSTTHARTACSAPQQLLQIGADPSMVAAGLTCIVSQRLVRRLCRHCAEPYIPTIDDFLSLSLPMNYAEQRHADFSSGKLKAWAPKPDAGCDRCIRGYRGRLAVHEVLILTEEHRLQIASSNVQESSIYRLAMMAPRPEDRLVPMVIDGLQKVIAGLTSIQELKRAVS